MAKNSNRRDFLLGRSALNAARDAAERAQGEAEPSSTGDSAEAAAESGYLVSVSRKAMGGEFAVSLNAGQYADGTSAALDALDGIESLEQQLSYFLPESEISRINQSAGEEPVAVSRELFELLQFAAEMHRQSQGALDITSAPLWAVWGFSRRQGAVPDHAAIAEALERVGSQWLAFDEAAQTVRFLRPRMEITLASIGKGYALDRCASRLESEGVRDFLMHGGGSSIITRGARHGERLSDGRKVDGWSIGVSHPLRPGKRLGQIILRDEAVGTSGSATQFFRHEGKRYSHILDPRTGWPARGLYSVTVVARTALEADAYSTAFFVMGPEQALAFCRKRPDLAVLLVAQRPHAPGFEIIAHGFDAARLVWDDAW